MNTSLVVVLVGIPGVEGAYPWILGVFCLLYALMLVGNILLLLIIKMDASLHIPMYDFVSMLALIDTALSLATLPTVLGVFSLWFSVLSVPICLLQMFFIHSFSVMESSVLLTMAYDRYVAICNPLRYSAVLTTHLVRRFSLLAVLRGILVVLPIPVMVQKAGICPNAVLSHAFCLHPDIMRLLCSKAAANNIYSIFAVLSTMGLDALLIVFSYALILRAVCQLRLSSARWKVFGSCVRHLSAVLLFYSPMIGLSMIHRFVGHKSTSLHVPMAYLHFLLPPALNPIVYGLKTKRVAQRLTQHFRRGPKSEDQRAGCNGPE